MDPVTIEGFRLSSQQRRIWLTRGGASLRVACALEIAGPLDAEALAQALSRVAETHEILRTRFPSLPGLAAPVQAIAESPAVRLTRLALAAEDEAWEALLAAPLDLVAGPLVEAVLLAGDAGRHRLLLALPALLADGRTLANFGRELGAALTGGGPAEVAQYVDYAEWQNDLAGALEGEEGREHWRTQVLAAAPVPTLPWEAAGEEAERFAPSIVPCPLPAAVLAGLARLDAAAGAPPATALFACLAAVLSRLTDQPRLTLHRLFDGRTLPQLAPALGPFARFLPVVCRIDEAPALADLVSALGESLARHEVWQDLAPEDAGTEPAVQLESLGWPAVAWGGEAMVRLLRLAAPIDRFKLKLSLVEPEGGPALLSLAGDPARLDAADLGRLAGHLAALAAGAVADPRSPLARLPLLAPAEREQILNQWNATVAPYDERPIHEQFAARAAAAPEVPAVVAAGESLSYGELDRRAGQLARRLARAGVGPEVPVGLCLERSAAALVALLAIWKAGGAYVPLDPALPAERLRFFLADTGAPVVLTEERLAGPFAGLPAAALAVDAPAPALEGDGAPPAAADPDHLAYVLYTSGSTGRPKGVMVRHRGLSHLLAALAAAVYDDRPAPLKVGVNAALAFDSSVKQLIQLAAGHTLHLVPTAARLDSRELLAFLAEHRLDALDLTPTQLRLLLEAGLSRRPELGPALLLVGGEAIDPALWAELAARPTTASFNVYGPTECTVDATACRIAPRPAGPTLGRPLANTRLYVTDRHLEPRPWGVVGELAIGGLGVSRGYLGRPELTALSFVPDPFGGEPGGRLYRSGDLARFAAAGELEFLGRIDHQVKIRGVRVELGEIEATLAAHPAVAQAAVVLCPEDGGPPRLVAYAAPRRRYAATVEGRPRHLLPNGMAVLEQNPHETDYVYREIFDERIYLRHGLELPDAPVVFDVGANIGLFSLWVGDLWPGARLHAFEPIPALGDTVERNCELHGIAARLFRCGLGEREGEEAFTFYPRYSVMSGIARYADPEGEVAVIKRYLANAQQEGAADAAVLFDRADELLAGRFAGESCRAPIRRLSDVLREAGVGKVDLLKVDVQRAELDVLRGIDDADWPKIRQLVLEVHDAPGAATAGRLGRVVELLAGHGFDTLAEQDPLLAGTDRHLLYARRHDCGGLSRGAAATLPAAVPRASVLAADGLREALQRQLPESMVPQLFVLLDALPVTTNGKVDRRALPAPESLRPELRPGFVAPRTETERTVADIWRQALRLDHVGVHDSFFDLGGNSLLLVQVHDRLSRALERQVSMLDLFQHPTISALAGFLAGAEPAADPLAGVDEQARRQLEARARRARAGREVRDERP